jgi:hypothetical protein
MCRLLSVVLVGWLAFDLRSETLPIHLEESHAGTFYQWVETLPFNEAHTLVLVDAHSDANGVANSDAIRSAIRQGPTLEKRAEMLKAWRRQGRIQCFNWLEPLMPAPLAKVIWIPAVHLEEKERAKLEAEAREYLDAHEEAIPRDAGPLASRYHVRSLEQFEREAKIGQHGDRIVASIDLDFFAKTADEELSAALDRVMNDLLGIRELKALTFAISSPYLRDTAQAERLTTLALDACWRVPNGRVSFEPFAQTGPDKSLMARLMERQGKQLPRLNLDQAGPALRSLLLSHWDTAAVRNKQEEADRLMAQWSADPFLPHLEIPGEIQRPDGSWSFAAGHQAALSIVPEPTGAKVRWFALHTAQAAYRIGDANFGFSANAPKWMWQKRILLGEALAQGHLPLAALKPALDASHQCGTVHLYAEVERDGEAWRTPTEVICIRAAGTSGARAAWSEQFSLPYIFDSRLLVKGYATGPDTHWGADCAAFVTSGLRAQGWLLPWGSPKDLRQFLQPVTETAWPAGSEILIDFNSHVAALWKDKPPIGQLNATDLCVHQLEGEAEVISFGTLSANRAPARIMVLKAPTSPIRLVFAGDLMLGRSFASIIKDGGDPLTALKAFLAAADFTAGNLECVISDEAKVPAPAPSKAPRSKPSYQLIAPQAAVSLLNRSGFDALSVANNHSLDLGPSSLTTTKTHLIAAGIIPIESAASHFLIKGVKLTLLAWDDSQEPDITSFISTLETARAAADYLVIIPHWGTEHQRTPTARQRRLAAAFLHAGADLVVGSGPHIVQPLEHYPAGSIAFSLGNTVFDGQGPDLNWSHGALLEVTLDGLRKRPVRMRYLPLKIDGKGYPELLPDR